MAERQRKTPIQRARMALDQMESKGRVTTEDRATLADALKGLGMVVTSAPNLSFLPGGGEAGKVGA